MSPSICFCLEYHPALGKFGGAEIQSYLIGQEMAKRGWEVHYTCRDVGQKRVERVNGGRVHKFPDPPDVRLLWRLFDGLTKVWTLLHINTDIYYQRGAGALSGYVRIASWLKGNKFVFATAHIDDCNPDSPRLEALSFVERLLYRLGLRFADAVVCQADYLKMAIEKEFGSECEVIRPGHPAPKGRIKKAKPPIVAWVGNLRVEKRPEDFIELAGRMEKTSAKFVMVGGGEDEEKLRKLAERAGVEFLGHVPLEDVNQLLCKASLLVNTSYGEGFPNVFLQAWLRETPVVTSGIDPDGLIERKGMGVVSKGLEGVEREIRFLLKNEVARTEMGRRARFFAEKNLNLQKMGTAHDRLFRGLL